MLDPQVGDHFHEMYSFDVIVVRRKGDRIATMEGSRPWTPILDGKLRFISLEEFWKRFDVKSEHGPWVMLNKRNCNVRGWLMSQFGK